ncbi:hypothetical protein [Sinorhizobium fredii]|uniref:hypothetical protein n=1 Tax=Rhizobium fredii TaxID=380 RepID=UPI0035193870
MGAGEIFTEYLEGIPTTGTLTEKNVPQGMNMRLVYVITTALLVSVSAAGIVEAGGDVQRSELAPLAQEQIDERQKAYDPRDNPLSGENIPFSTGNANNLPPEDRQDREAATLPSEISDPNAEGAIAESDAYTTSTPLRQAVSFALVVGIFVTGLLICALLFWALRSLRNQHGRTHKSGPRGDTQTAGLGQAQAAIVPAGPVSPPSIPDEASPNDLLFASRWAAAFFWFFFGGSALAILLAIPRAIADVEDREFGMLVSWGAIALSVFGAATRQPLPWIGRLDGGKPKR